MHRWNDNIKTDLKEMLVGCILHSCGSGKECGIILLEIDSGGGFWCSWDGTFGFWYQSYLVV
jgi:hypothetical protein